MPVSGSISTSQICVPFRPARTVDLALAVDGKLGAPPPSRRSRTGLMRRSVPTTVKKPSRYSISWTEVSSRFEAFSRAPLLIMSLVDTATAVPPTNSEREPTLAEAHRQIRIALDDVDPVHGDAEGIRHHLGVGGLQPLSHRPWCRNAGSRGPRRWRAARTFSLWARARRSIRYSWSGPGHRAGPFFFRFALWRALKPSPVGEFRRALQHVRETRHCRTLGRRRWYRAVAPA